MKKALIYLALILFLFDCNNEQNRSSDQIDALCPPPKTIPLDTAEGYVINQLTGDSIQPFLNALGETITTGHPILSSGEEINIDTIPRPLIVEVGTPAMVPANTNVHKIPKELRVDLVNIDALINIPLGKGDTSFVLKSALGDTIPTGVPIPAKGKVVPVIVPRPKKASAPRFRDNSVKGFQYLDVEQGLSSSQITAIMEDQRGNIWFATSGAGVNRYDGEYFTHFTEKEGLNSNNIICMLEDKDGNLWFGSRGGGISRYDGKSFTHFTEKEGLSSDRVECMLEDQKGNLWIGSYGGISRYDGEIFTHFTTKEGLSLGYNAVLTMLEDQKGNLWIGTNGSGVNRFDGKVFSHFSNNVGFMGRDIKAMLEDKNGNIWFAHYLGGLSRYDGKSFTHFTEKEGLNHAVIWSMIEDHNGDLWFGSWGGGVSRYDGKSFTHFTKKEGLSDNIIMSMMEDRRGDIWLGSLGGGVIRYNREHFSHFTEDEGLSSNLVNALLEDQNGAIWMGTYGGGVTRYDNEYFSSFSIKEGLNHPMIMSTLEDQIGNLWFGSWGHGVARYDGTSFTYFTENEGLNIKGVLSMLEDRKGNIWIADGFLGLNRYNGKSFTHFPLKEGRGTNNIRSILEDQKGDLWFGSMGLLHYDGTSFTYFTEKEGLSQNHIGSLMEDRAGNIWMGTSRSGIIRYDGTSFSYITEKEGLSNNSVSSMLEDPDGNIWVGTKNGLSLLIRGALPEEWGKGPLRIRTFGNQEGLKGLQFGRGVLMDSQNRIWWGTIKNLSMLDWNQFRLTTTTPEVSLISLDVNGQFLDSTNMEESSSEGLKYGNIQAFYGYPLELSLSHHLNHLTFRFSALEIKTPGSIKYSYKIESLKENWSAPNSESQADYRNLPYGKHTFKVRAIGDSQIWSEPFEYTFSIRPPWWLSWWAYTLYILLTLSLIMAIRKYEIQRLGTKEEAKKLKELDGAKTRLYNNITHEFRTPLTVIMGMAGEINDNPIEAKRMIQSSGDNLLRLINQMLDLSKLESGKLALKPVKGDIISYLKYITESFHSFAETKKIQLHFYGEADELVMDYDEEKIQQVVSNLLYNAIKFTPEQGKVFVHSNVIQHKDKEDLVLKIKDNGIGILNSALPYIFDRFYQVDDSQTRQGEGTGIGLALTKELVQLMKGNIAVKSTIGKGTEFIVTLPVTREAHTSAHTLEHFSTGGPPMPLGGKLLKEQKNEISVNDQIESNPDLPLLLIIEDNADVVAYIKSCIKGQYVFDLAANGQQGINKALELVPDIIISDVMMPEKDGFEVCQTLKNDQRCSHIPIILLTAKATEEDKVTGFQMGADAYLIKPFNKAELVIRLQKLVELRQQLQKRYSNTLLLDDSDGTQLNPSIEDDFIQKMNRIVEAHMGDENFSILHFCRAAAMSRTQLHRKLKALTGKSASLFIRSIRLQKAMELLKTTDLNISTIAYEVGIRSPAYFSTIFLEEFGVNPSEIKK